MSKSFYTENEIPKCPHCGVFLLDDFHNCQIDCEDENSYNSRLKRGFEMLDIEGEQDDR